MTRTLVRSLLILSVAIAPLAGGIAGCSKEEPPPQPVVRKTVPKEQAKSAEGGKPAEGQAAKPAEVVFYNPAGKRDPFVPFFKVESRALRAGMENVSPLQRYELGELKFVGMIWGPKGAHALVEDAEGKGYTVTVGTKVGRGGGVVTRITDGEILVKEEFRDFTGARIARESSMKLQNAGGK
jgi:type IV pilus assembly protein PilP